MTTTEKYIFLAQFGGDFTTVCDWSCAVISHNIYSVVRDGYFGEHFIVLLQGFHCVDMVTDMG